MLDEGRKITYIRVYSGKIKTGEDIYNANNKKKKRSPGFSKCTQIRENASARLAPEI